MENAKCRNKSKFAFLQRGLLFKALRARRVFALCAVFFAFCEAVFPQSAKTAIQLYNEQNYDEAMKLARSKVDEPDSSAENFVVICRCLIMKNRVNEALYWANEAAKRDIYDTRLIEAVGEIHFMLGNNDLAMNFLQQYVAYAEVDEKKSAAYFYIGEIFIRQQKYNHADIALSFAVLLDGFQVDWLTQLGYVREKIGNYRASLDAYSHALSLDASNTAAKDGVKRLRQRIAIP